MKRTFLFIALIFCTMTLIPAQGRDRMEPDRRQEGQRHHPRERGNSNEQSRPAMELISVKGNLTITQGRVFVKANNTTYIIGEFDRLAGFVDGLKEGAAVTVEGYASPNPRNDNEKFLRPQKMILEGKEYDLEGVFHTPPNQRQTNQNPPPQRMPRQ